MNVDQPGDDNARLNSLERRRVFKKECERANCAPQSPTRACDEFQAAREEVVRQIFDNKLGCWRLRSDLRVVGELEVLWGS